MSTSQESNDAFRRLKAICVPLLNASLLTPSSIPQTLHLLKNLHDELRAATGSGDPIPPSLAGYVFFPLSSILRRNAPLAIPDQVMEKVLLSLSILIEAWWWSCDLAVWEQMVMLCGAVVSGMENRNRDEETKIAAAQCLLALLRERTAEEAVQRSYNSTRSAERLLEFQHHARTPKLVPIIGQTLNALLDAAQSPNPILQGLCLQLLSFLITIYAPGNLLPSILPGVVSGMVKVTLGVSRSTGRASGSTVSGALQVLSDIIVHAIGDEICIAEGAVHPVTTLEELATLGQSTNPSHEGQSQPYMTTRTPSWLRGTSSQVHIALNSLTSLVSHPTPSGLLAFVKFSATVLRSTPETLPQSSPLLLSFLLSLSNSDFESVASSARVALVESLANQDKSQHHFTQILVQLTRDNLTSLPRFIASQSEAKVVHAANTISAVCRIASSPNAPRTTFSHIPHSVGKLLGPSGGIEKWGWTLLSVLEFVKPHVLESDVSVRHMLENDQKERISFTYVPLKYISSYDAYTALATMLNILGHTAGDECLFAIEWFANIGYNDTTSQAVAALWCASRLMEGLANISLADNKVPDPVKQSHTKRLEKTARMLSKKFGSLWDKQSQEPEEGTTGGPQTHEESAPVEFIQGLVPLHRTLRLVREGAARHDTPKSQPFIHQTFCLQIIAVAAGILRARFAPLLLYTLYPVLHSLTSPDSLVLSTAMSTLDFITMSTSYASPSNLLVSNFDYALDGVSRRLTKRWLDIDATKVLVLLVRLVGSDVVDKAGDIVEECFTRLDDYHGYDVLVDGLVEVLGEVVKTIDGGEKPHARAPRVSVQALSDSSLEGLFHWLSHRNDPPNEEDDTAYGPVPREAWGNFKGKETPPDTQEVESPDKPDDFEDVPPTVAQTLTKQIVAHSLYFLTHGSPVIRARILDLLASSVPILPQPALLSSINTAWPFILNRLADHEPYVVGAAASLIEALALHAGTFMFRRIWDDIWPCFHKMLEQLNKADSTNALSRRGQGAVGTESAYSHSHRLYRALLRTMSAAMEGVDPQDSSIWQVLLSFRRFLHKQAHEELQTHARALYTAIGKINADAVWLVLRCTDAKLDPSMTFMYQPQWDINDNIEVILHHAALI
ncbi:TEL2-interacting protein 1 [Pleurotus pulmonarius]